jgi:hypothetical protein
MHIILKIDVNRRCLFNFVLFVYPVFLMKKPEMSEILSMYALPQFEKIFWKKLFYSNKLTTSVNMKKEPPRQNITLTVTC